MRSLVSWCLTLLMVPGGVKIIFDSSKAIIHPIPEQ